MHDLPYKTTREQFKVGKLAGLGTWVPFSVLNGTKSVGGKNVLASIRGATAQTETNSPITNLCS